MRIRQALVVGLVTLAPALTGCLTHIRAVPKTHPPEVVLSTTLDQLLTQVDARFNEIQTINATVEIHGSWRFLPWHRMYLYFHERILAHL